ncbi:hypothetical protein ACFL5E_00795 [Candidatus Omnitrophota bacterium]
MDFRTVKKAIYREGYIIVCFLLLWFILNLVVMSRINPTYSFHRTVDWLAIILYLCYWAGRMIVWLVGRMLHRV